MIRGEEGNQLKELEELVAWIKESDKPDIICLSNALLIGMARRLREALGIPVICLLEGEDTFLDSLPSPEREKSWSEIQQRVSDVSLFIASTQYYSNVIADRAAIPRKRLVQIYNGINLKGYKTSPLPDSPPVLGYFTRLCPEKGLDSLIDAYIKLRHSGRIPNLKLAVGGGCQPMDEPFVEEQKNKLRKARLMDEVTLEVNIDRDRKLKFYSQLTLLSVPALYGEAFGLYIVEAMASGVPIIAPDDASFPEMVEETGAGVVFKKDSKETLANTIEELLLSPEQLKKYAKAGRTAAANTFNIQQMASSYIKQFTDLI